MVRVAEQLLKETINMNINQVNTLNDAHELVRHWIMRNGNYLRLSYQREIVLRELLVDYVEGKFNRNKDEFFVMLREQFPEFYHDMVG